MANSWYAYLRQGKDPLVPTSYRKINRNTCPTSGMDICAIYLPGTAITRTTPFSANILTYLTNALATLLAQPQTSPPNKLFVYVKRKLKSSSFLRKVIFPEVCYYLKKYL